MKKFFAGVCEFEHFGLFSLFSGGVITGFGILSLFNGAIGLAFFCTLTALLFIAAAFSTYKYVGLRKNVR